MGVVFRRRRRPLLLAAKEEIKKPLRLRQTRRGHIQCCGQRAGDDRRAPF
jgi:hypothetical protein